MPSKLKVEKFEKLKTILDGGVDVIVVGVSSVGIEWFVNQISKSYKKNTPIILLTKGNPGLTSILFLLKTVLNS